MSVLANLNDIEREAQARLPGPTFDYFAGGGLLRMVLRELLER